MKFIICFFLLGSTAVAFGKCDIEPLKQEIISQYKTNLPVTNEKGEIGHAKARKIVVSEFLMKMKNDNFLIANFDLDIKWLKGTRQTVKTLVVATVNLSSCSIDKFENKASLESPMASKD